MRILLHCRRAARLARHMDRQSRSCGRNLGVQIPHRIPLVNDAVYARDNAVAAAQQCRALLCDCYRGPSSCWLLLPRWQHHELAVAAPKHDRGCFQAVLDSAAISEAPSCSTCSQLPYPEVLGACLAEAEGKRVRAQTLQPPIRAALKRVKMCSVLATHVGAPTLRLPAQEFICVIAAARCECHQLEQFGSRRQPVFPKRDCNAPLFCC
mmetsp:Transcript_49256/g.97887  ORF Transcript_49256/g.97887 Transcript_49256/m.97887 type:complete len:209 (+) Transcript_49256:824-1450(+)